MTTVSEKMTALADAIRGKTGSTDKLSLDGMVEEIGKIKRGFPNGTEWIQSNITDHIILIYYAKGLWVAASYSGELLYSTDGKIWNKAVIQNYSATNNESFLCVYYANGIWVAGTQNGLYYSVSWEP